MPASKKPAIVIVEPVRARAIRGPREDGRWYWRAEVYQGEHTGSRTLWTGWAHREEVSPELVRLIAEHGLDKRDEQDQPIETLKDLLEVWLGAQEERADITRSAKDGCKRAAKRLADTIGGARLDAVDLGTLRSYQNARLRTETNPKGISTGTLKFDMKRLNAAWRWGQEMGLCPDKPLPSLRVRIVPTRNKHTPTRADLQKVIAQMEGWPRLATILLAATGCRVGEIADLTWADVDLEQGILTIRKSKTGEGRLLPLAAETVAELSQHGPMEPAEHVLGVSPKRVRSQLGVRFLWAACDAASVERFSPHGLRRSAVDALLRARVDVGTAAAFFGHSPQVMLEHYRRATLDDTRAALDAAKLGVFAMTPLDARSTQPPAQPTRTPETTNREDLDGDALLSKVKVVPREGSGPEEDEDT